MPTDDELLGDMLLRWDELREQGQSPPSEEMCRDHPHLLSELNRRITALGAMSWIDESGEPEHHHVPPSSLRDDPPPGASRLGGRYRLDRLIAEGGSGQVWQGYDEELQRSVAVKVPRPSRSAARPAADFLAEGRRVARLDHPGIVPVYDVGLENGRYYIVSKLVDGESLADRLRRGCLPPVAAARLVAEVARTLASAHLHGYIHRDIKPANILLDLRERPFLVDFGIAVRSPELLTAGRAGTLAYMSPEQVAGEVHRLDARTDIYGLGVVLYETLTGRQPFRDENPVALRRAITDGAYSTPRTLNRAIPAALDQIVVRCLSRNPDDRHPTAEQLADVLDRFIRPHPKKYMLVVAGFVTLAAVAGAVALMARSATRGTAVAETAAGKVSEPMAEVTSSQPQPASPDGGSDLYPVFRTGSVWEGTFNPRTPTAYPGSLTVAKRTGGTFQGVYSFGEGVAEVEGELTQEGVTFRDTRVVRGRNLALPCVCTCRLNGSTLTGKWWHSHAANGTFEFTLRTPDNSADEPATPILARLAGTTWVNSNGVLFEWRRDGTFVHNQTEKPCRAAGPLSVEIDFNSGYRDTLVFDKSLTRFDQHSPSAGGGLLHTGRRVDLPDVLAAWRVTVRHAGRTETRLVVYYMNGRLDDPSGDHTWVRTGNVLVQRWADPQAPGGVWVDTLRLSTDGTEFSGRNQNGTEVTGRRVHGTAFTNSR